MNEEQFRRGYSYDVGIDPGKTGGVAFIDTINKTLEVFPIPTIDVVRNKKEKEVIDVNELARPFRERASFIRQVILEQVGAYKVAGRAQGVTSMFTFGEGFGMYRGIIAALQLPVTRATPNVWKKDMRLNADKSVSRERASELMPHCSGLWKFKYQEGLAEAALLALWGLGEQRISVGPQLRPVVKSLPVAA